jgi:cell division protein FtsZ
MEGAHGVLLSISGGSDLGLFEINEAASLVSDAAHPDANIIFGAVIDDALGDEVRVTVIAAGFDNGKPNVRKDGTVSAGLPGGSVPSGLPPHRRPAMNPAPAATPSAERQAPAQPAPVAPAPLASPRATPPAGGGITVPPLPPIPGPVNGRRPLNNEDFEEELDIPEFLKQ